MDDELKRRFLQEIDDVFGYQESLREQGEYYDDLSNLPDWEIERMITMALAAMERIAGADSVYASQARAASTPREKRNWRLFTCLKTVLGILGALRAAVVAGYLRSTEELVHASLFADFVEMASHLLAEGYKDPAAVLAGSTLESHLRQLCLKNSIDTEVATATGPKPKRADKMNADLARARVFGGLDQKNVTAWLDLRNKAAHGKYDEYTAEQVDLLISGVREFMSRTPA